MNEAILNWLNSFIPENGGDYKERRLSRREKEEIGIEREEMVRSMAESYVLDILEGLRYCPNFFS